MQKREAALIFCSDFLNAESDIDREQLLTDVLDKQARYNFYQNPIYDNQSFNPIFHNRGTGLYQFKNWLKHEHQNNHGNRPHYSKSSLENLFLDLEQAMNDIKNESPNIEL